MVLLALSGLQIMLKLLKYTDELDYKYVNVQKKNKVNYI